MFNTDKRQFTVTQAEASLTVQGHNTELHLRSDKEKKLQSIPVFHIRSEGFNSLSVQMKSE